MAVTHPDSIRTVIADAVVDSIDTGGAGTLEFQTSGDVEVATVTFGVTAFGAAAAGVATANAITDDPSATGNASAVAKFVIKNGSAALAGFAGAVAVSGSDINMTSLVIAATDVVELTSLTYTACP